MSNQTTEYSKSKQKRMAIQEAAQKEQRKRTTTKVVTGVVIAAIVCGLGYSAYAANLFHIQRLLGVEIDPSTDYSACLTEEGKIEGVTTSDYVGTIDASAITLNESDVTYTDEELDTYIDGLLDDNKELVTDEARTAASGDAVSINYVGTIDGVEFDGGSADNYDLELGSGSFIDDFEDQLVGSHPGDDVTVNVTFPDDYSAEDLQGKDAEFAVHINGVYEKPAFDDAFVQANLADSGYTTAEEYKEGYRTEQVQALYASAIDSWIAENVTPSNYPKAYLKNVKGLQMTADENTFQQYKAMYEAFGMSFDYDDYQSYFASDDQTYTEYRDEQAETAVTKALVYQNVFENAGLSITDEDYQTYLDDNSLDEDDVETYGKAYIMQQIIQQQAARYLQPLVNVEAAAEDTAAEAATETVTE